MGSSREKLDTSKQTDIKQTAHSISPVLTSPETLSITLFSQLTLSNGQLFRMLDSQSRGPKFKTTWWLQGRLTAFHPSKVNQMSTRIFWVLKGKK